MKILFVIRDMSLIEHLGVMYLSSIAKESGHKTSLAIINEHNILDLLGRDMPDMLAFSIMSVDANIFMKLAMDIKEKYPKLFIVAGGPHCTFNPDIIDFWHIDALIAGEGDIAFRELLYCLEKGADFSNISNLLTKQKKNPLRNLIEDLDILPDPDRELVYYEGGHLKDMNVKSFMTSRGCAFKCTYCFNNAYNKLYQHKGKAVRRRSVGRVIGEIKNVQRKYPIDFVRFGDDVFCYSRDEWLEKFAEKYSKEIGLPFYCLIRPNLVSNEVMQLLSQAGCHSVSMSIEAGGEDFRYKVLNRKMSDEVVYNAFRIVDKYGIHVYANCMLGLPFATIKDELITVETMAKCNPSFPSFNIFTPFKGVELTDLAEKHNLINQEVKESTWATSVLNCFSEKEKKIHVNIMHLGAVACRFPVLKPLILKYLIYLPPNRLFFLIWFLSKNYLMTKYIFPVKASFIKKLKYGLKVFLYEFPLLKFYMANRFKLRGAKVASKL